MSRGPTPMERGAVAVEMAIVLPLLFLLVAGIIDLGRLMFVQTMVTNAAREGARMVALGYDIGQADDRVEQASPMLDNEVFGGPLVPDGTEYVECPDDPGPEDVGEAQVGTVNFEWLVLDVAFSLFGGDGTAPQPTANASMRCLG